MSSMNPVESPALVGAVFVNISVAVVAVALNTAWSPERGMGVTQVGWGECVGFVSTGDWR